MEAMVVCPADGASLRGDTAEEKEDRFDDRVDLIAVVGIEAVIPGGDRHS